MWKRQHGRIGASHDGFDGRERHGDIASLMLFLLGVYDPFSPGHDVDTPQQHRVVEPLEVERSRCAKPMHHCRASQRTDA